MATKNLFGSKKTSSRSPATNTVNEAGGTAYSLEAKEALAQMAVTGCFQNTFYASGADQLSKVRELVSKVDHDFVGKLAIYSREKGFMKDMPSFLIGYLTGALTKAAHAEEAARKAGKSDVASAKAAEVRELSAILWEVFPRVVDNGKMLRNFVQIIRSGETGRKSFGTSPKKLIRAWFDTKTDETLFFNSLGNDPSMADVIKLIRPTPMTKERAALYGYFLGKTIGKFEGHDFVVTDEVPEIVRVYEAFKREPQGELPKAPYEMLEGLPLSQEQWKALALKSTWAQVRQHLNTFLKKGVFTGSKAGQWDFETIKAVAAKLTDEKAIERAKAMPYQLMIAYLNMGPEMPVEITNALQDAMEIASKNVPVIDGVVAIFPDVSGSMHSPVTGMRVNPKTGKVESHTSKARCIDVAALVAASVLRSNPRSVVIPFVEKALTNVVLNPKDSIMTNARKLSSLPCGGTNCSAALKALNDRGVAADLCWYVSDNESWVDSPRHGGFGGSKTATLTEWDRLRGRNPKAKLVCMDVQPYTTTQAPSRSDILNVGGFNDSVFEVVKSFWSGEAGHWVEVIERSVG